MNAMSQVHDERAALKALIVMTSAYYGQRLDDTVVEMYAEDLADLPLDAVRRALVEARRDPKQRTFPLPAVIRDKIQPFDNADADAKEAAGRIVAAVSRFGWNNVARAREYVGELGWAVVERQGGWETLCRTLTEDNIGQMQAQWRDLALSVSKRAKLGILNEPPRLVPLAGAFKGMFNFPEPTAAQKQLEAREREEGDEP